MRLASITALGLGLFVFFTGEFSAKEPTYKVLSAITESNLTIFPVTADLSYDTSQLLTLDEGIRSGQVTVTEIGRSSGLVRPRPHDGLVWPETPLPLPPAGPRVNQLALVNNADRPLLLLAGEIVTGGKQDRIVGKDRIVPAHSEPISLDVFCVEPHRWMGASARFDTAPSAMAQPSIRSKAMAESNQQDVWNEVAKSRLSFAPTLAAGDARAIQSTSSYAAAMQNSGVQRELDSIAAPIERSYSKLIEQLRAEKAVGAVVAVNNEIIWADVFASPALLEKYWPKLVRSYAAETFVPAHMVLKKLPASEQSAQEFLDHLYGNHENVETDPGIYRNTEIQGDGFDAFILTSLLPNTGFRIHIAKMKQ